MKTQRVQGAVRRGAQLEQNDGLEAGGGGWGQVQVHGPEPGTVFPYKCNWETTGGFKEEWWFLLYFLKSILGLCKEQILGGQDESKETD